MKNKAYADEMKKKSIVLHLLGIFGEEKFTKKDNPIKIIKLEHPK